MAVGSLARIFLKRRPGLLLTELLITVAIVGLAAAILLPQIYDWHRERLLTAATEEVCALIRTTQAESRSKNTIDRGGVLRQIQFSEVDGRIQYRTYLGATRTKPTGWLPEGISLAPSTVTLIFNLNGFPKNDKNYSFNVMLADKSHARRVTIARYTGRIRVENAW